MVVYFLSRFRGPQWITKAETIEHYSIQFLLFRGSG